MAKIGPFRVKTVHGEPIQVGDWTLIPVVRVLSFGQARATIGSSSYGGWGGGFVRVRPVAVIAETEQGRQRIPIVDATSLAVRRLIWLAVGITAMFAAIRGLPRRVK